MMTVDSLVKEKQLESINLIKIDTEGFELSVLEGATETLKGYNPELLVAAYHFPQEYLLVSNLLRKYGYNVYLYWMPLFLSLSKESYLYASKKK